MGIYDLVIIGGGPAGISAALYACRQKLNFLLLTKAVGGLAAYIPELKTYPGISYIHGYELVEKFAEQLEKSCVPVREGEEVQILRQGKNTFTIQTDKSNYEARAVIVASGRKFKKLGITGEAAFEKKGVSFCAVCDGPIFKGKDIAIIGGGRSGLFSTLFMLNTARKIYLVEKSPAIKDSGAVKQAAAIIKGNSKVKIHAGSEPVEIIGDVKVTGLKIKCGGKTTTLPVDAVFVEIGYEPNTEFLGDLVELNNRGEVIIDKGNMSDVAGIFAAGDVTDLHEKQVIVAVGEGAKAALSAMLYLEKLGGKRKKVKK